MITCLLKGKDPDIPKYHVSQKYRHLRFYLMHNGDLYIKGSADHQFCNLFVKTTVFDSKGIPLIYDKAMFGHLDEKNLFLIPDGLEKIPETKLLLSVHGLAGEIWQCEAADGITEWHTPFGHIYKGQQEYHGTYFAGDIRRHWDTMKEKCKYREADGTCETAMAFRLSLLDHKGKDAVNAYESLKPLLDIIADEGYLKLSDNKKIRDLAVRSAAVSYNMYQEYMQEIGGSK